MVVGVPVGRSRVKKGQHSGSGHEGFVEAQSTIRAQQQGIGLGIRPRSYRPLVESSAIQHDARPARGGNMTSSMTGNDDAAGAAIVRT